MVGEVQSMAWRTALVETAALAAALATGWSVCQWGKVPILAILLALPVAALASLAAWGFFRGWARLALGRPIADFGPGELNWWLAGGVWTSTIMAHRLATSIDSGSMAGPNIFLIGSTLSAPVAIWLAMAAWKDRGRHKTTWADRIGYLLTPVQIAQVAVAVPFLMR